VSYPAGIAGIIASLVVVQRLFRIDARAEALAAQQLHRVAPLELSGLLAGSMTDPPALAFAINLSGSDAPTIAYATVYPLTTLLRILTAQILALMLIR
jgi:uncharacterized transporter YbjL